MRVTRASLFASWPLFAFVASLFIVSCASIQKPDVVFDAGNYDAHFTGFEDIQLVQEQDIFLLNQSTKNYIKQRADLAANEQDKALTLIHDLFSPAQLALDYVHGANTIAQKTFDSGKANCLSLTILAYSMAREAGLEVKFYEVFQEESWSQFGDFDLANGHVNLKISAAPKTAALQDVPSFRKTYTVDFFPTDREGRFRTSEIDKDIIMSYFYSNLAAKALMESDNLRAYAHVRKALQVYANDSSAWNNLALILKRQNLVTQAIDAYQQAINLRPDNFTAWENMAVLLAKNGEAEEAQKIRSRLEAQRRQNPNYFIRLGNRYLLDNDTEAAEKAFRQSLKLDNKNHYAWFGLARVSGLQGDKATVLEHLERAKRYGRRDGFSSRYASKIEALSQ